MPLHNPLWQALALNGWLAGLVVLAFALLPFDPTQPPTRRTQLAAGIIMGCAAILAMALSIEFAPGVTLDVRPVIAAVGTFMLGPLAGGITIAMASAFRLMQGGIGALPGVGVLLSVALLGWAWRVARQRAGFSFWPALVGLGVSLPFLAWAWSLGLPPEARPQAQGGEVLLQLFLTFLGGVLLLGSLLELVQGRARSRSQLRRLNEDLRESEKQLLLVIEASGGGRWEWDMRADRASFRGHFYDAFGFNEAGRLIRWKDWRELWHADDAARMGERFKNNFKEQVPDFDAEFRVRDKLGRWRWLLSRGRVVERDAQGRPVRMIGMHHDITSHREVEDALRMSQAKFETIYQVLPDSAGIARISDGSYLEVNPAFCTQLGYTREEVIGKTPAELQTWASDNERKKLVEEFMRRGQVDRLELLTRRRNGEVFAGLMSARRIEIDGEDCFFFLFHETTTEKRIQAELRSANALLQQASRLATLGVWEIAPQLGQSYWSEVVYEIHGLPSNHPLDENYIEHHVAEPYREAMRRCMRDCIRKQMAWDLEMQIVRADGRKVWVHVLGEPIVERGRAVRMRGVIQDIDEARRNLDRLRQSEELFSRMFQLMPEPMGISRQRDGHYLEVNAAWQAWMGYSREEALGRSAIELRILTAADREAMVREASRTGQVMSWEVRLRVRSGELRVGLQSMRTIEIDGEPCWLFGIHDVTERRQSEARVREREELLSLTIEAASLGLWDWNMQTDEVTGDARWRVNRGLAPGTPSAQGRHLRTMVETEDQQLADAALRRHQHNPDSLYDVVRRMHRADGSVRWIRNLGKIVAWDTRGEPLRMVGVDIDVTRQREQEVQLEKLAHYDSLTGLPNRVLLADRLEQAMANAERTGHLLGVAYIDLDGFKPVNDRFGHEGGDRLLIEVAKRLKDALRAVDSVARLGGDEFVLLLADLDSTTACEQVLRRIVDSLTQPYAIDGEPVAVTASIGTTLFPSDYSDADTLMRHADQAMYAAKQAGRNRIQMFDSAQEQASRDRQQLLEQLRAALAAGEFVLYMQPKVDIREGRVIGAEALARWRHPQEGILAPARFLPAIETSELEIPFGEWVIEAALKQLDDWYAADFGVPISINISARHLQSHSFSQLVATRLANHPMVRAGMLEVELTESAALTDIDAVIAVVAKLRQAGIGVALDDFGTGYSSLTYLRRLPVDTLKIDQTFVHGMMHDGGDLAIVQGVIGLARSFRRAVVAEGVETHEQIAQLLRLGCTRVQGYGIARPMPADELPAWTREWRTPPLPASASAALPPQTQAVL